MKLHRLVPFVVVPLLLGATMPLPDMASVESALGKSRQAIADGDGKTAIPILRALLEKSPDHPGLLFAMAQARALTGEKPLALSILEWDAELGFALDAPEDPAIRTLSASNAKRFERVFARIRENGQPIASASLAFTLPERDLVPEGIAWDPATKRLFVSSLYRRKVVVVDAAGAVRDFVPEAAGGLWQVLGMKVDPARRRLIVCSAADKGMKGYQESDRGRSGVFWFDLESGAPAGKALAPADGKTHLFNDLAVTPDGGAFVTDSEEGSVWRMTAKGALERLLGPGTLLYPNGIALSPGEKFLYVASFSGIDRIELATRARKALPHPHDVTLAGVDGLLYREGELIAVQNGVRPARFAAFKLSPGYDEVTGMRVLGRIDPLVTDPTTAVAAGAELLAIGNAQIGSFDAEGKIFPIERLEPVRIVKIPLAVAQ
jgi:hypothetical protein